MAEPRWASPAEGAKDRALHEFMRLLPVPLCSAMGAGLARFAIPLRHRPKLERTMAALAVLRPELDEKERRRLALSNLTQAARCLAEFSALGRFWKEGRIVVEGAEHLPRGRVVVAGLHLGNWEVIGAALCALGHPVNFIYQPPLSPTKHAIAIRARTAYGARLIQPSTMAPREALRGLEADQPLLIYLDEYKHGLVNAPALGRPLPKGGNIATALRLAARTGAPLVAAYALREPGPRFRLRFLPPLPVSGDLPADIAALEGVIDPVVRANLEQWLMLYCFRPLR
ncbi:lysophospholipid acyltransferase family protein [Teichococcus rhizosphaerae]|nr:lysophospholipid acyltransferase family protein [Pseudoroseomonas rhizosphaerae]